MAECTAFKYNTAVKIGWNLPGKIIWIIRTWCKEFAKASFGFDLRWTYGGKVFKSKKKTKKEAVVDFRIDFEDGFGNRFDKEEDETMGVRAAREFAKGIKRQEINAVYRNRIKTFSDELERRAVS